MRKKNVKHLGIVGIFFIFFFSFSYGVMPLYTGGDQKAYRTYYDNISHYTNIAEGYSYFTKATGSREFGYFFTTYFFSKFLDKDLLITGLNAILGSLLIHHLLKYNVHLSAIIILSLNYYLMVLFFSAERLKIALLLYGIAFIFTKFYRYLFIGFGILTHVQLAVLFIIQIWSQFSNSISSIIRRKSSFSILTTMFLFLFLILLLWAVREHIVQKLYHYYNKDRQIGADLLKILVFISISIWYSGNKKFEAFASQSVIFILAFFVGGNRLVIFSYFIFLSYAFQVRRGVNIGVFVTGIYFFIRGIYFVSDIILHGDGFIKHAL